jgi:Putative peptidoglycan binding domain
MPDHIVEQGECLESIALDYGFFWDTLWNLPENRALKDARKDPNALYAGDVVHIPERREKPVRIRAGATHTFKRKGVPAQLDVVLQWAEQPRANEPYELIVDGKPTVKGNSDGDGRVKCWIAPDASRARLIIGAGQRRTEYDLELGGLDPFDEITGIKQRLKHLGLFAGDIDETLDADFIDSLRAFQESVDLDPTGATDPDTLDELRRAYDSKAG